MRVPAGGQHDCLGAMCLCRESQSLIGVDEGLVAGTGSERQIEVCTLPCPAADFIRIACKMRVVRRRIGVDRAVQHVVAPIENGLRPIAVMGVEVEDGDTREVTAQDLGRHRCVVEEAESGRAVAIGVVARRSTKGERSAFSCKDRLRTRDCDLRRCVRRSVSPLHDGTGQIAQIPAGTSNYTRRARRVPHAEGTYLAAIGMDIRKHLRAVVRQFKKALVRLFEERDIVIRVDLEDRLQAIVAGIGRDQAEWAKRVDQDFAPGRDSRKAPRSSRAPCTGSADDRAGSLQKRASSRLAQGVFARNWQTWIGSKGGLSPSAPA